ncbi:MAG: hypothetical protein FGM50_07390, partial [Mycobacterium sp.]|nr:hypothetical protein [Mycobacterium sp.]
MHLPVRLGALAAAGLVLAGAAPAWASAPPTDGTAVLDPPQPGTGVVTGRVIAADPDGDPLLYT